MVQERRIDDLIQSGLQYLGGGFDQRAFEDWRGKATDCLRALLGGDHTYIRYFSEYVQSSRAMDLLAGEGILVAAREVVANKRVVAR